MIPIKSKRTLTIVLFESGVHFFLYFTHFSFFATSMICHQISKNNIKLERPDLFQIYMDPENVFLSSTSEISFYFSQLKNMQQPNVCIGAISKLSSIISRNRFSVIDFYFDNLFFVIKNATEIAENMQNVSPHFLIAEQIVDVCLNLLNQIASFPRFFINEQVKLRHITELYNLLPHENAYKALGKLLVINQEFAFHVIQLGIDKIFKVTTEDKYPLFIWFLGSFAMFPELNQLMAQFYEKYILMNCTSPSEKIRKYCYNAINLMISESADVCKWISNYPTFNSMFQIVPTSQDCAKNFLDMIQTFLKNGVSSFLINNSGILASFLCSSIKENDQISICASNIILLIAQLGFSSILIENQVEIALLNFLTGKNYSSFNANQAAMKAICFIFASSPYNVKTNLVSHNIEDIVSTAIETGDPVLHFYGLCALHELVMLSKEDQYSYILENINDIIEQLSVDEYDEIMRDM